MLSSTVVSCVRRETQTVDVPSRWKIYCKYALATGLISRLCCCVHRFHSLRQMQHGPAAARTSCKTIAYVLGHKSLSQCTMLLLRPSHLQHPLLYVVPQLTLQAMSLHQKYHTQTGYILGKVTHQTYTCNVHAGYSSFMTTFLVPTFLIC